MTNDRSTKSLNQVFGSSQYFLLAIQAGDVRLPLCEMSEANQARLRKTIEEFEKSK